MGAFTRLRLNLKPAMDRSDTLAHIDESEAPVVRAHPFQIEPYPAVPYGQGNLLAVAGQFEFHPRGLRVFSHVRQAFLGNAIEARRDVFGQGLGKLLLHEDDLDARFLRDIIRQILKRGEQPQIVQDGRMELIGHAPHVIGDGGEPLAERLKRPADFLDRRGRVGFQASHFNGHQRQPLIDVVMQFAGDPPTFFFLCRHQLSRQRVQLLFSAEPVGQIAQDDGPCRFMGDGQLADAGLSREGRSVAFHGQDITGVRQAAHRVGRRSDCFRRWRRIDMQRFGQQAVNVSPQDFMRFIAEQFDRALIEEGDRAVLADDDDGIFSEVQDAGKPPFG